MTTHRPTRNTVCMGDNGDLMQPHFGPDHRWAFRLSTASWRLVEGEAVVSRHHTLADAVLWVAEGER
jgi:hypothetical protein